MTCSDSRMAIDLFLRRYYRVLQYDARRWARGSGYEPEELVAEAYIRLYSSGRLTGLTSCAESDGRMLRLFRTSIRDAAVEAIRRSRTAKRGGLWSLAFDLTPDDLRGSSISPTDRLSLKRALEQLQPSYKSVISLRVVGHTTREIAAIRRRALRTVEREIWRALRTLGQHLQA